MSNEFQLTDDDAIDAPVLVGLMGAPSSGKTWSAYELATGMQRATGGDIAVIDTEAKRGKHYIARFRERARPHGNILHLDFGAPFSADRYVSAIEYCASKGCKTIIIDSASHSHNGPGGMLDHHADEVERLLRARGKHPEEMSPEDLETATLQVSALAWTRPKQAIKRMVTDITTSLKVNAIFCFRAEQKRDWNKKDAKRQPLLRGWIPVADISLVYELTVNFLLNPGADGMPDWSPEGSDAGKILKRPEQFRHFLVPGRRIDSDMGEEMAAWAMGKTSASAKLRERIAACATFAELELVGKAIGEEKSLPAGAVSNLRQAYKAKAAELQKSAPPPAGK